MKISDYGTVSLQFILVLLAYNLYCAGSRLEQEKVLGEKCLLLKCQTVCAK